MHGCRGHAWLRGVCMVVGVGACMVVGGIHGCRGHMHGCGGTCIVAGGMRGFGACVVMGGHARDTTRYGQ